MNIMKEAYMYMLRMAFDLQGDVDVKMDVG